MSNLVVSFFFCMINCLLFIVPFCHVCMAQDMNIHYDMVLFYHAPFSSWGALGFIHFHSDLLPITSQSMFSFALVNDGHTTSCNHLQHLLRTLHKIFSKTTFTLVVCSRKIGNKTQKTIKIPSFLMKYIIIIGISGLKNDKKPHPPFMWKRRLVETKS